LPGALAHSFPHPAWPVDNFVDNAAESPVPLTLKTPGQPGTAEKQKIKPF
jgi:hypothetical protein